LFFIGAIIIEQPATGTLVVLALSSTMVYVVAGMSATQFFSLVAVGISALSIIIKTTPYRAKRILSFLIPESDPLGKGYHIIQSLIGIGSGGLLGIGFGRSIQKFNYLPESHTDAIFSIIAEEFGFLGSFIIIVLFVFLISIGFKIARRAPDSLGKFLALPFISYGGSSMVATLISIGILSNIAKQT